MDARTVAAQVIGQVTHQRRPLTAVAASSFKALTSPRDRRLAQELVYGVFRWYIQLETVLAALLKRPLKRRDADVHALLLIGLYQLEYLRTPTHAAVASTVEATRTLGKPWATSLINAVLRSYLRDSDRLLADAKRSVPGRSAHPDWLIDRLRSAWPQNWQDLLEQNNRRAPMTLRVNRQQISRDAYMSMLKEHGLDAQPTRHTEHGITLDSPVDIDRLPGFESGLVSVQDGAAQLAAPLMELAAGQRVLDACAAPGGKTAHCLETQPALATLVAVERDATRIQRLRTNLERLQLNAEVINGDAGQPGDWWWTGCPSTVSSSMPPAPPPV